MNPKRESRAPGEEPSGGVKEPPIEHIGNCRRPQHGNQQSALAERNQTVDREFVTEGRRRLQQTRSSFPQCYVNQLQSPRGQHWK